MPSPTSALPPLLRIQRLLARMVPAFPECRLSLGLLVDWTLEQIGLQRRWAGDVRAIDDPLEENEALLERALANDPPAVRRKVKRLLAEVHHRTERTAAELAPVAAPEANKTGEQ